MFKTLSTLILAATIGTGTAGTQLVHHWPSVVVADDPIGPQTGHRWLVPNVGVVNPGAV